MGKGDGHMWGNAQCEGGKGGVECFLLLCVIFLLCFFILYVKYFVLHFMYKKCYISLLFIGIIQKSNCFKLRA